MSTGAQLSNLTPLRYDFVVGTTQLAINKAMFNYIQETNFSTVQVCWTADDNGEPVVGDCNSRLDATGVKFFNLGNTTVAAGSTMYNQLAESDFFGAMQIKIGVPEGVNVSALPDIVDLQGGTSDIAFQMYAKEFNIVWWNGNVFKPGYESVMQDPRYPWIYKSLYHPRHFVKPANSEKVSHLM
ncbi:hypothetical protein C8F04DRAFT_1250408 [Mycena alexandri]|uniref:Uncharacterized protein n=1 Tax=Mycena alexandri TaxID=1745969 RepID=A0AAD6TEZ7_9AGAR|nr:hypothetical protein C8F04DRAFT_1250408 [Mycena alexandri]